MDLFDALVRLEVQGWTAGPARPDRAEAHGSTGLARLLKKAGSLAPPDGSPAYDFCGELEPAFADGHPMIRLRDASDGTTWLALVGGRSWIWRVDPAGDPVLLARSLSDWLGAQVQGAPEPSAEPSRALWDLGLEGEGWGWALDALEVPARLDRASLPEDLRALPLHADASTVWAGPRVGVALPSADATARGSVPASAPGPEGLPGARAHASSDVDELFGDTGARPRPRTVWITSLLVSGLALTVLGMACIAAPGGVLVLLAWMAVEKDTERLESGYLPESDRVTVERLRRFTYAGLLVVVVLFAVQGLLLCNGAYDVLLDAIYLPLWQGFVRSLLGG